MHDTGSKGSERPWLIIRQDGEGNHYRVGRYATRTEAQRVCDRFVQRGHRQLYRVERLGDRCEDLEDDGRPPRPDLAPEDHGNIRRAPEQIQQPAERPSTLSGKDPTSRRVRRARPLFHALVHILPADDRDRYSEEWLAEWIDHSEKPLRTRLAYLLRVMLRSVPYFAWTLRTAARRQRTQ